MDIAQKTGCKYYISYIGFTSLIIFSFYFFLEFLALPNLEGLAFSTEKLEVITGNSYIDLKISTKRRTYANPCEKHIFLACVSWNTQKLLAPIFTSVD